MNDKQQANWNTHRIKHKS